MTVIKAEEQADKTKLPWFRYRHLMTALLLLGCTVCYSHRAVLSIGIVAMVDRNNSNPDYEEFDWDSETQNVILSSFLWGYSVFQVPSGLIAQALGAKVLLLGGVAISSIVTLVTPIVASNLDWQGVCAMRVIAGLCQGGLLPSISAVISKWAPPKERSLLASIAFSGAQLANIITYPLGGLLASSSGGWPSIFYVFGSAGLVWCVAWMFLASSYPADHRWISETEKKFIEDSLKTSEGTLSTPWLAIFTSLPMWAILLAHPCQNWGYWTLLTEMPTYMKTVLGFDIKSNGFLSALPYLVGGILSYVFGYLADQSSSRGWLTNAWTRKAVNTVGFWGPALALAGLGFIPKDEATGAVALLVVAVGLNSGAISGFLINHVDLSPNFAGTMMGITSTIANIISIVGPLAVGIIVTEEGSAEQWRIVFLITAGLYFVGNCVFLAFADGVIQPWDDPAYGRKQDEENASSNGNVVAPTEVERL